MILNFNKGKTVVQFYYNCRWSILYSAYIRGLDNLFLTYEFYYLALLDCELILNIVLSPADESSLLLKRCVECLTLSDDGKVYTIVKELHGKSVLTFERYLLSSCPRYENTKAGVPPSHWYTTYLQDHRVSHPRIQYWLPIFVFMFVRYCRCPLLALCASLPLHTHLCMKYCVTSSMG